MAAFDFWKFLAGLGIFLLSMTMVESGLNNLAGRSFKKFLRSYTDNPLKAILAGMAVTAILQSSSVVSLMVLALVGAGILELKNALGMIIGSNLGTTFTGWIIAVFGFSFDIDSFAFPLIAIGGLISVFFANKSKSASLGSLIMGMGFLFLGLDFMKSGIETYSTNFDITPFSDLSPYLLFPVGFVLTAIIQSSSASMVITLSALNAGLFGFPAAAAMVLGSDLGTTITVLLGGIKGTPAKKRVALSHFIYNLIIDVIALLFLFPLIALVEKIMGTQNPLLNLVAFHSCVNLFGVFLFLPFLKQFANFLNRRFIHEEMHVSEYIYKVTTEVPEVALEVLQKEIKHLIYRVFHLHADILNIANPILHENKYHEKTINLSTAEQYKIIKELEGELADFYIQLLNQNLEPTQSLRLRQLLLSIRNGMTAAKGVKDIVHNFYEYDRSINDELLALLDMIKKRQADLYLQLFHIFNKPSSKLHFEALTDLKKKSKSDYENWLEASYKIFQSNSNFTDLDISTLFTINREIHNSNKALIAAVKEILLPPLQSEDFDALNF